MADNFSGSSMQLDSPARSAAAVTPNDSADLPTSCRALYVGAGGDIKVTMAGGDTVTFTSVPQGMVLPIRAARVWATGTTAASLVGVW